MHGLLTNLEENHGISPRHFREVKHGKIRLFPAEKGYRDPVSFVRTGEFCTRSRGSMPNDFGVEEGRGAN